ncbi:MAG: hypothetical protein AB1482_11655 [Pseudomonadota bacterium]
MTQHAHDTPQGSTPEQSSLSGLPDHPELLRVRLMPAQFARALGVSKQSVSRWVRDGWVTLAADGRLDPSVAIGQLLRRCDPGRLRARWLRQAVTDVQALREAAASADERVAAVAAELGAQLVAAQRRIEYLEFFAADLDCMLERVLKLVVESELALRATPDADAWAELVVRIEAAAAETCDDTDLDALDAAAADALAALTAREAPAPEGGGGE